MRLFSCFYKQEIEKSKVIKVEVKPQGITNSARADIIRGVNERHKGILARALNIMSFGPENETLKVTRRLFRNFPDSESAVRQSCLIYHSNAQESLDTYKANIKAITGYLIKDVDSFMDSVHTSISRIEDTANYRNRVEDLESLRALLKGG